MFFVSFSILARRGRKAALKTGVRTTEQQQQKQNPSVKDQVLSQCPVNMPQALSCVICWREGTLPSMSLQPLASVLTSVTYGDICEVDIDPIRNVMSRHTHFNSGQIESLSISVRFSQAA